MVRKRTTEELTAERPAPEEFRRLPRHPMYVVLNDVRSLLNVGVVFRWCDAARVERLYLCGITGYPPVPGDKRRYKELDRSAREIGKTAIKTVDHVPWEKRGSALEVVGELRARGVQIAALELTDDSINYPEAPLKFPVCLVLGHERAGVPDELLEASDLRVEVPLYGMGSSLNVTMSLGIVLYELLKRLPAERFPQ